MVQARDAVWVPVLPSMKDFGPALVRGTGEASDDAGKKAGKRLGKGLLLGIAGVGAGAAAATKFLYDIGSTFDDVTDTIRTGTGAQGKALDGLVSTAKNVGKQVPSSFKDIGSTVADVNTRMGLSGKNLETVASQYLQAGNVLGETVDINKTSAAFAAFGIEGDNVSGAMDHMFQVSQATGVGMNQLAASAQKSAPAMKTLGFSFEETTALVGSLDKAGLNSGAMMGAMSKGLVTLAKDGEKPQEAFQRTVKEIDGFVKKGDQAGALNLASKVFGTKGATQFVDAIGKGTVSLDSMSKVAGQSGDTILGVGKETADFAENWMLFKNNVLVWLEPLASKVFGALGTAMGEVTGGVKAFGAAWKANDGEITSSGFPGFLEGVAFQARRVFDFLKPLVSTVLTGLRAGLEGVRSNMSWIAPMTVTVLSAVTAWGAWKLGVAAWTTITKGAAAVQRLFNLALKASPLMKIVTVLGAVVGGLTYFFTQTDQGRAAWDKLSASLQPLVQQVLPALGGLFSTLMTALQPLISVVVTQLIPAFASLASQLMPVFAELLTTLLPPLVSLLTTILVPALRVLAQVVTWVISTVVVPLLQGLAWIIQNVVAPAISFAWTNIIKPVFKALGDFFAWVWTTILKPSIDALVWYWNNVLAPAITWVWNNILKPVFKALGDFFKWVWENVLQPAFKAVGDAFKAISDTVKYVWEKFIQPVFRALGDFISKTVVPAFQKGVDAIKKVWETVANIARVPINFVIETVYNNGLKSTFNGIAEKLGLGWRLPDVDSLPAFAKGGLARKGWALVGEEGPELVNFSDPGRVYTAAQTQAMLDGQEQAPTAALPMLNGGHDEKTSMLPIGGFWSDIWKGVTDTVGAAKDWVVGKIADGVRALVQPVKDGITNVLPGSGMNELVRGSAFKLIDDMTGWAVKKDDAKEAAQEQASQAAGVSSYDGPLGRFTRPSAGPITSLFGTPRGRYPHAGIDIAGGGPTFSAWDGVVQKVGTNIVNGRTGVGILIGHGNGMQTYYGHNPYGGPKVSAGDKVTSGQRVGAQGATGNVTGVHLHWETWKGGQPVNPAPFLHDQGGVLPTGVSTLANLTRKPEAVLNARQWESMHAIAMRAQQPVPAGGTVIQVSANEAIGGQAVADAISFGMRSNQRRS